MHKTEQHIKKHFKGSFLIKPSALQKKLSQIKAYVFDWDGVFNDGQKNENGSSSFSEVDAMGTNLLRFNHYLRTGKTPVVAIISSEKNKAAFTLAEREHFDSAYYKVSLKTEALKHLCSIHKIKPTEVAFFFDDVLDLAAAKICGLRIMIGRQCNPLLTNLVKENNLADYITACGGSNHAIRESSELLTGLSGKYEETILQRMNYTKKYQDYLKIRNKPVTAYYTSAGTKIKEQQPL